MNALGPNFWEKTRQQAIDNGLESYEYAYIFWKYEYDRIRAITSNFSVKYLVTELSYFALIDLPGHP